MSHTVEKIGGTSIANTAQVLKNVLLNTRGRESPYNRIFVVSAYAGITDQLLEHKKSGRPGVYSLFASAQNKWAWSDALSVLGDAMKARNAEIFGTHSDREAADAFVQERVEGVRNCLIDLQRLCSYGHFRLDEHLTTVREMLAALGEAHSACNTALLLRQRDVNAVFVDLTGWRDDRKLSLDERIVESFRSVDLERELPIATGYAGCADAMVGLYGRGYSEVTFSRIAVLTAARGAIIHKQFHLSSADPRLVGKNRVRKIGETNYDVADQLANMGMEAIHPKAAKGLRQANIPLSVMNTFDPDDGGTLISSEFVSETPKAEIVTGLPGIFELQLFEQDMVGVKGYDTEVLKVLTRHNIRIVSKCSNANTITHYVDCSRKALKRAVANLEEVFESAEIKIRKVAIVSVIGTDLNLRGLTAKVVCALEKAGVCLLGFHQLTRNVDLQAIIDERDFETAVKALHARLIEDSGTSREADLHAAA